MAIIGSVLVATIAVGAYVLSNQSKSSLPAYLAECVTGTNPYHAHVHLAITINGLTQTVPAQVGITGGCLHPLHTHSTDGVIHIEPDQNRTFTLGDFFMIWGQPFNSTQLMFQKYTSPSQLNMTVTGVRNAELWNFPIPRNAEAGGNPCSLVPTSLCVDTEVALTLNTS